MPHIGTQVGKLEPTLIVSATSEEPSPQIALEEGDSPSMPRASNPDSLQPDADAYMSDDPEGTPESGVPAEKVGAADALRLLILLLVPGLAVAGFLIPVVVKMVSKRPIDVPGTAWVEHPFLREPSALRGRHDGQDHRQGSVFADPRSREQSAWRNDGIKEPQSVLTRHSKTRFQHPTATSAKPLEPNSEGIERALRAIRQARRQQTA